jgi:PAS domain S-box-containing protein
MDSRNNDSLSETEQTIIDLSVENPSMTNAEIADEVGVRVAFVRDIRDEYLNASRYDTPSVQWSDYDASTSYTAPATGTPGESAETTTGDGAAASAEFNQQPQTRYRLKHLFTSLPDPVVETEFVGGEPIVRRVNTAFESVFGYDDSDIIGQPVTEFVIPERSHGEAVECTRQSDDETHTERIVTRTTATGVRPFLHRHVPYEHNGDQYAFEVYSDVTEQQRRKAELEWRNEQIKNKKEQFEQFASILAHDLRNPINIASGYLDEIKTEENADQVAVIERAHDRMRTLIDETLTLKEESELVSEPSAVAITEVATSAWDLVETGDSELCVVDEFEIVCDSDRVSRLFENLFRNAIDHNEGPVTVRIGIHDEVTTSTRADSQNAFYIADDGCGVPKAKREQVFDAGESEARDGTGLGLAIVRRIADSHQWDIKLVESFDEGCKFVISNVEIE